MGDLLLLTVQLILLFLTGVAQLLKFSHDPLALLTGRAVLTLQRFIAGHHVTGVIKSGQQLAQGGGLGNEDQDIEPAILFHRAYSGPITAKLFIFHRSRLLDFDGLFRDRQLIDRKLLLHDLEGGFIRLHFLLQRNFLSQYAVLFILKAFHALLGFFGACCKLFLLLLKLVNLLLLNGKSSRQDREEQGKDHDYSHHKGQDGNQFFTIHTNAPLRENAVFIPSDNS